MEVIGGMSRSYIVPDNKIARREKSEPSKKKAEEKKMTYDAKIAAKLEEAEKVVRDAGLRGMTAQEVVRKLREKGIDISALMVTHHEKFFIGMGDKLVHVDFADEFLRLGMDTLEVGNGTKIIATKVFSGPKQCWSTLGIKKDTLLYMISTGEAWHGWTFDILE